MVGNLVAAVVCGILTWLVVIAYLDLDEQKKAYAKLSKEYLEYYNSLERYSLDDPGINISVVCDPPSLCRRDWRVNVSYMEWEGGTTIFAGLKELNESHLLTAVQRFWKQRAKRSEHDGPE